MTPETLQRLDRARSRRRLAILATRLGDGAQHLLCEDDDAPDPSIPAAVRAALAQAAGWGDRGRTVTIDAEEWFVHPHPPTPRLLVVGAVHIAQVLAPLARMVGLAVTVIDPRTGLATRERFPGTELLTAWPDQALRQCRPDRDSAIVTLSHDPKLDDPALRIALDGPAFYIGALGSRKTQAERRDRLAAAGCDQAALQRLRGPAGLAIGAIGPQEIALSILAEIVAVRRAAPLGLR